MSTGLHRLTKAGLKRALTGAQAALRDEKATSARLADELALARQQHAEERTRSEMTARREIRRLTDANRAWEARYANEHPVHVPAPKDLRADDDRPTVPGIDVTELRDKFRIPDGRIIRLTGAPFAANPSQPQAVDLPQQRRAS
jgi:hypothetical protein